MREKEKNIVKIIQELLWPERCLFCGKVKQGGLCPDCVRRVRKLVIKGARCMRCSKPLRVQEQEYCRDCEHTYHYYDKGCSLWLHKAPISTSIYQFKYHNQRNYGAYYAREMVKRQGFLIEAWRPDLIIPIPLHPKRKRQRGYNQAGILAEELGHFTGIPVDEYALIRCRYTSPQKTLDSKERKANMSHAFRVREGFEPVKTVLLIDDIYTTGNTVSRAAEVLKNAKVANVYFFTISIGQGY